MKKTTCVYLFNPGDSENATDGHFHSFWKAFSSEAKSTGVDFELVNLTNAKKKNPYRFDGRVRSLEPRVSQVRYLGSMLAERLGQDAVFHIYDGGLAELLLCAYLRARRSDVRIVFNLHQGFEWFRLLDESTKLSRSVAELICLTGVYLFAESGRLAAYATQRLGFEVFAYPIFSSLAPITLPEKPSNKHPFIVFLPRSEAQEKLVENALEKMTLPEGSKVRVHSKIPGIEERLAKELQLTVDFSSGSLGDTEYQEIFRNADVVVLPYSDPFYQWGSSGKYVDSLQSGAVPISPDGAAMSSEIGDFPVFSPEDPLSLASTISATVSDLADCRQRIRNVSVPQAQDAFTLGLASTQNGESWVPDDIVEEVQPVALLRLARIVEARSKIGLLQRVFRRLLKIQNKLNGK